MKDLMANECEYCGETIGVKEVVDLFHEEVHEEIVYRHFCEDCYKEHKECWG